MARQATRQSVQRRDPGVQGGRVQAHTKYGTSSAPASRCFRKNAITVTASTTSRARITARPSHKLLGAEEQRRPDRVQHKLTGVQQERWLRGLPAPPPPHQPGCDGHRRVQEGPHRAEEPVRRSPWRFGGARYHPSTPLVLARPPTKATRNEAASRPASTNHCRMVPASRSVERPVTRAPVCPWRSMVSRLSNLSNGFDRPQPGVLAAGWTAGRFTGGREHAPTQARPRGD